MNYFDYLETRFTEANSLMATKNPQDVTVPRQAMVNAVLSLVGMSRSVIKWGYVLALLGAYFLIALKVKKAPEFKSSIPAQPIKKPELAVVQQGPNTNLQD